MTTKDDYYIFIIRGNEVKIKKECFDKDPVLMEYFLEEEKQ